MKSSGCAARPSARRERWPDNWGHSPFPVPEEENVPCSRQNLRSGSANAPCRSTSARYTAIPSPFAASQRSPRSRLICSESARSNVADRSSRYSRASRSRFASKMAAYFSRSAVNPIGRWRGVGAASKLRIAARISAIARSCPFNRSSNLRSTSVNLTDNSPLPLARRRT